MLKMEIKRSSVRTETTIKSTDRKMTKRKRRSRIRGKEVKEVKEVKTRILILRTKIKRVKAEKRILGT